MVWVWLAVTWVLVALVVTLVVGRAVRLADRSITGSVPNFVVQMDPAERPLPPVRLPTAEVIPEQATTGSDRLAAEAPRASRRHFRLRSSSGQSAQRQPVRH